MKRILSLTLAFLLIFPAFIPIKSVHASDIYEEAGKILYDLGVLTGINKEGDLGLGNHLNRQDMVVLISRLYGKEDEAKKFDDPKTPNTFKDLAGQSDRIKFYTPYIRWAVSEGLMKGHADGTFGFDEDVTVQQFQTVLLRALQYNDEANDWNNVPDHAKKYKLMEGLTLDPNAGLTRGQMAVMTLNALKQEINRGLITLAEYLDLDIPAEFQVEATVTNDNNTAVFAGQAQGAENLFLHLKPASTGITSGDQIFSILLDEDGNFSHIIKDLQVGTYQYRFQSGTKYTDYELFTIDILPFDLVDVDASNLKEITLSFTQPVDRAVTSLLSNYTTTAGPIKEVRFEEDDTKIILVLAGNMTQQMKYKISAMKIKSKAGEEIKIEDHEFLAFDNQPPQVSEVIQLGTKGLRLYLSEPIKNALASNFKINGRNFPGTISLDYNIVTLTYFSSSYALSEGNHILTVTGLEDYTGYKIVDEDILINISKDTTPPSIESATATLDQVIIEFDEEIDPVSASVNNFYWRQSTIKRYASKVTIRGNKAIVDFTTNRLTTAENTIYVENVVDYSGNKIKPSSVSVIPEIDMTPPEIIHHTVSEDGKTITVYFNKNVLGTSRSNYSILDSTNRTINIKDIQGSGNEFKINLYVPLPVGLNTLIIEGVQDTTPLRNTMIPYTATIDMKDVEKPRLINYTGYGNNIILYFSKPMDMNTVINHENYIIIYGGKQEYLPANTLFIPGSDEKSVNILLPEYHTDGKRIMIGTAGNLTSLNISRLKDLSGNVTDPVMIDIYFDSSSSGNAKAIDYDKDRPGRQGALLESNLIKVRFNMPIVKASTKDFTITGRTINSVIADGTDIVTIYLDNDNKTNLPDNTITINQNNTMKTIIDTGVESGTIQILDRVAPKVKDDVQYLTVFGNMIELPFTEELEEEGASLYKRDLEIVRLADNKILNKDDDYSTALKTTDKSVLVITIKNRDISSSYLVRLAGRSDTGTLSYIRDLDGNLALPSDVYYTQREIPKN
ncbi:MAG: hypothetical protein GX021_04960 [Tissierellia bacterium]|nr:hypothetical protein [Tissierellia bacterium]